ncbi:MAG: hypothetical protein AB7V43_15760 [Acidimicrobiia bacterium]
MDDDPVRVLLIEGGRIPFDPVIAALERLRPATEHRFSSRLHGCHQLGSSGLAVVTDHHPLGSLERVIVRSGPGTEAEALLMAAEVGEAVMHCHGAGFVHGHVGPGTVMLGDDGHPRLAAHGALGELEAGLGIRPTPPGIVPPEGRPSAAGDVFAIGLIAVYAATGMLDPRAMPKRWAPLVGPALDPDPAHRPTDLRMFVAGLRSVADALMAGAKVAVVEVPGGTSAMTGEPLAAAGTATSTSAVGGPQAVVDGLQLNKVPRRRGQRLATLGSVAALAATGVAAVAIYAATTDDQSPSTTVSVPSAASSVATVPGSAVAPAVTTVPPITTSATAPTTAVTEPPVSTVPPLTVPVATTPVATTAVTPPETTAAPTTRRTTTTSATTTRATTPSTRTSPPTSSPGATTASTLPPDVERGRD